MFILLEDEAIFAVLFLYIQSCPFWKPLFRLHAELVYREAFSGRMNGWASGTTITGGVKMERQAVFLMDALLLEYASQEKAEDLLPYVLERPIPCPWCDKDWVLMMNRDVALEVQQARVGQRHLELLLDEIGAACAGGVLPPHLRTDGERVWRLREVAQG
jgi:hypothetical protein